MQIIRKNFGLKILSLALAIVGWAYFRFAANPVIAARFDQQISVPIVTENLAVGYVAHFTEKEAVVSIATKRGEPAIKPDEIKAVLDLSNKDAGAYNVPVQLVAPNVEVQSLSPASISLTIERIEDRSFPLSLHYAGAQSSPVVVSDARTVPVAVSVRGPTSALAEITDVRLDVAIPPGPRLLDAMVRPVPVNSFGEEIAGVDVTPDLVRVRIRFVSGTGVPKKP